MYRSTENTHKMVAMSVMECMRIKERGIKKRETIPHI